MPTFIFTIITIAIIYVGYAQKEEYYISAEHGLGYAFGITGGVLMLLLLIYPLRKRYRILFHYLTLQRWFQIHMLLGVIGPLFILFHSNFSLGSTNSSMAMLAMGLMVFSGVIGRYLYSRVHKGLYGHHITLGELNKSKHMAIQELNSDKTAHNPFIDSSVFKQLKTFELKALERVSVISALLRYISLGYNTRITYRNLSGYLQRKHIHEAAKKGTDESTLKHQLSLAQNHIGHYLLTIRKISVFNFYERLFSGWHMLHLPIFFLLIITGLIHVYAVHVY